MATHVNHELEKSFAMKRIVLRGAIASVLASFLAIIYQEYYQNALACDFSSLVNPVSIAVATAIGCLLMTLAYLIVARVNRLNLIRVVDILIVLFSCLSVVAPIDASLSSAVGDQDLFVGLTVPMHLLPAMIFFFLANFFKPVAKD